MTDDEKSRNEADQRTLLALMLVVFCSLLLLGLMALVVPHLLGVFLVIGGLLVFGTGHYVVWGWWLPRYLNRHRESDESPPH